MRIVSGKYRGKILHSPQTDKIKPTLDKVKEAIFGSIQFYVPSSKVLDLFSGSGALGIEAFSRGAASITFCDTNLSLTRKNLASFETSAFTLIEGDYLLNLKRIQNESFDIILIDPPYATDYAERAIEFIDQNNMLSDNGVLVWEKSYAKHIDLHLTNLVIKKIKKYGTVQVIFLEKITNIK